MIKCITFDLDDTLWAVDPVVRQANITLIEWLAENAPRFTDMFRLRDLNELRNQVVSAQPEISHSVSQIRLAVLEAGLTQSGYSEAEAKPLVQAAFDVFLEARQQVEFFEHAMVMLETLSEHGYIIGALSNGNADVTKVGLGDLFDFQFNADQVGSEKPAPEMFQQMLDRTGLHPHQVIHIGDNPIADIQGAQNMNLWTIWVNLKGEQWTQEQPPTKEVHCLSQIPTAVEQIIELAHQQSQHTL